MGDQVLTRMASYSHILKDITEYTVMPLLDSFVEVALYEGKISIFALSVLSPTYYDLCMVSRTKQIICYGALSHKDLGTFQHSGDIMTGGTLLHHFSGKTGHANPAALFVSGYRNNPLHKYSAQRPAVFLVNHDTRTLYLIPVPLDEATIGKSTICIPLVGKPIGRLESNDGDLYKFAVMPNPPTSDGFASGSTLPAANQAFAKAFEIFESLDLSSQPVVVTPSAPVINTSSSQESVKQSDNNGNVESSDREDTSGIVICEQGCQIDSRFTGIRRTKYFGNGISDSATETDPVVILPCCLGNTLSGPLLLALGAPYAGDDNVTFESYTNMLKSTHSVVFVSDRMRDQAKQLNRDLRLNGLFVISPKVKVNGDLRKELDKLGSESVMGESLVEAVEKYLNALNVNAITALSGPQSIVVVKVGSKFLFYRGIRWPGFLDAVPNFGADVTDLLEKYLQWTDEKRSVLPWDRLISLSSPLNVYFRNEKIPVDGVVEKFSLLPLNEMTNFKDDIMDVLIQLQCSLGPEELQKISTALVNDLQKKSAEIVLPLKRKYMDYVLKNVNVDPNEKARLLGAYRTAEKVSVSGVKWLINYLGSSFVSQRTSSTREHNLKQILRKNQMANNLAAAKDLTYDELTDILDEHCSMVGVVIGNVNIGVLHVHLKNVAKAKFLETHHDYRSQGNICSLDTRAGVLTGLDAGIVATVTATKLENGGPLASIKSAVNGNSKVTSIALPQFSEEANNGESSLPWACFDEFVAIDDPGKIFWPEKCLESHIASLRILLRQTICDSQLVRGFISENPELSISPSSNDLSYLLVAALLDVMDDIVSLRTSVPTKENFDDNTCRMLRGLFGHLFTMLSAGTQPLSYAWQLVGGTATTLPTLDVSQSTEWWIYSRVARAFPYTAWPPEKFNRNVKLLITRTIRKFLTDPVTQPMRNSVNELDKAKAKDSVEMQNKRLKGAYIITEVVREYVKAGEIDESVLARLISKAYDGSISGYTRGYERMMDMLRGLQKGPDAEEKKFRMNKLRRLCCSSFCKRSGFFKDVKIEIAVLVKKYLKDESEETRTGIIDAIKGLFELRRSVAETWDVEISKVKVQNLAAYEKLLNVMTEKQSIDVDLKNRVLSDAEKTRVPWNCFPTLEEKEKGYIVYDDETIKYILGKSDIEKSEQGTEVIVKEEFRQLELWEELNIVPKSGDAVKLAKSIDEITIASICERSTIPKSEFLLLAESVGVDIGEGFDMKVREMVKTLLTGWRDTTLSESKALKILN
ncbi:hypothetical protein HK098_000551 [Nowakowskiella sp. JEL0407]|nr:hypothetical protein HK098_000551 [Nowakowskiella sp. JEL0407]